MSYRFPIYFAEWTHAPDVFRVQLASTVARPAYRTTLSRLHGESDSAFVERVQVEAYRVFIVEGKWTNFPHIECCYDAPPPDHPTFYDDDLSAGLSLFQHMMCNDLAEVRLIGADSFVKLWARKASLEDAYMAARGL